MLKLYLNENFTFFAVYPDMSYTSCYLCAMLANGYSIMTSAKAHYMPLGIYDVPCGNRHVMQHVTCHATYDLPCGI